MIWRADRVGESRRDAVHEHVRGELLDQVRGRLADPWVVDDVAAVVAAAWREDFHGVPLPPDSLALMAARIMWRVGEADAARALAERVGGEADESRRLLGLVEAGGPSLSACIGLGSRVLRPAGLVSAGDAPGWTLDLAGLTGPTGALVEFDVPVRVRRLLERTAEIWDGSDGGGVLWIARPHPRASAHLAGLIRRELPGLCRMVLDRIGRDRGWRRRPAVCRLCCGRLRG